MPFKSAVIPFAALVVAFAPASATALIQVNGDRLLPIGASADQTVYVDVFLVDLDGSNERLQTFTLAIEGVGFSETGIRFAPPVRLPAARPSAAHPFVFKDFPGAVLQDFDPTATRLQIMGSVDLPTGEVDVNSQHSGLLRVPIRIPAHFVPDRFFYPLEIRSIELSGRGPPITAAVGPSPGGVLFFPEPSAAALLTAPALALLCRRRRA